jgi:glycosyltransferase involved in cell wall biosynthesis
VKKLAVYTIINPKQPDSHLSGGFAAIDSVIEAFEANDCQTTIITPKDTWIEPSEFDAVLYADIFNDPQGSEWFKNPHYEALLRAKNYVVLECAYTGCTPAPYGLGGRVNGGDYAKNKLSEYMNYLMDGAAINIFLSPLHAAEFSRFLGKHPPRIYNFFQPINTDIFKNKDQERDIPYLFAGALNSFKGLDEVIDMFGDKGLHIVGRRTPFVDNLPRSIKYLDEKTPAEMAEIYNRTVKFVHLPRWQEPSARTVVEAALCGCELIVNENVGVLSFGYDIRDPNISQLSKDHIRQIVGGVLTDA